VGQEPGGELHAPSDDAVRDIRPVTDEKPDLRPPGIPETKPEPKAETKPEIKAAPTEAEIDAKHGELLAEAAAAARERLRKKGLLGAQVQSGLDPQDLLDLAVLAASTTGS
jgi:hypothetical protein